MEILVTVIMPVYNVEKYLDRSIQSVINQTFQLWELIIVNDGSTDNSLDIIKKYCSDDTRIKLINQINQGAGKARQNALDKSKGKYICFVDPDDFLTEKALEENFTLAEEIKPDLILNGYFEVTSIEDDKLSYEEHNTTLSGVLSQNEFRKKFLKNEKKLSRALWNKFYSSEFLMKNNCRFSSQRIGQDALFNYNVYKNINKVYVNNKKYYNYDSSREGSAIKGYKDKRAIYELNIANTLFELIELWNLKSIYIEMIYEEYWKVVYTELKNLNFIDCNLSDSQKINRIRLLMNNNEIIDSVSNINLNNVNIFNKLLIFLIKNKKEFIALKVMKIRMRLGNYILKKVI